MLNYIIGSISDIDRLLTVSQKGSTAVRYYLEKKSEEDLQADRNAILSTTAADIQNFAPMIADILKQQSYCVYGNKEKIESNKKVFKELKNINKN
jgi:Zn-dependent M16 (insulinase) family peptidase